MKVVNMSIRWNEDKCRCECEELVDKKDCGKGLIFNPSSCILNVINHVVLENT